MFCGLIYHGQDRRGLNNLTSVGTFLTIGYNDVLTNLDGLNNLTSVGLDLEITFNNALTNLDGLNNLTSVGTALKINNNDALTYLNLYSLNLVGAYFGIYKNVKLCTYLAEALRDQVLAGGGIGGIISIYGNKECP